MINVHEMGHTIAAWLYGDSQASYHLYQSYKSGGYCIGCNVYHTARLNATGQFWVSLAGVIATQTLALIALIIAFKSKKKLLLYICVSYVATAVLGDAIYQSAQGIMANVLAQQQLTNVDFADAMFIVYRQQGYNVTLIKVTLIICLLLYSALFTRLILVVVRERSTML